MFSNMPPRQPLRRTVLHTEQRLDGAIVLAELSQQAGGDGEQVAARQGLHLPGVPEGGTHHHRAIAKLLVVVEDLGHADHACIQRAHINIVI